MNYRHIQHRDTYVAYQELWYLFPIKRIMILLQYVCARINLCVSLWLKKKKLNCECVPNMSLHHPSMNSHECDGKEHPADGGGREFIY